MLDGTVEKLKEGITVLLPGLNGGGLELGQLPHFLNANGYETLIPTINGYLHGSPPDSFESWLSQIHNALDELSAEYKVINLLGISMGATLALAVASERNDVTSLVLLSPVLRYDGWSVPWYRFMLDVVYALGFRNWEYIEREPFGVKNAELRRRIQEKFNSKQLSEVGAPSITARHLHEAKRLMSFTRNQLDLISKRLLLIQSVEDDTCSIWSAEQILANVRSDLRRTIWLGNSYHIITIDNEREVVLNEVLRFLARTGAINVSNDTYYTDNTPKALRLREG